MADMMDRSGLILTDWAANQAQNEANRYLAVQRQQQQEQYAKAQAVETAANAARQQFGGGNAEGARQTAAAGNAWDVWSGIDTEQKAKVAAQATDIGTAAFNLGKLPKGQARVDYFNSFVPTLRSHGMSDQDIAQYAHSGFLDNDNALNGYRDKAIGIKELYDTEQATLKGAQEHAYKLEEDAARPITAADGAVLTRGTDGSISPIYLPGSKAESKFIDNADGSTSYVSVPGTAGTSYAPGSGNGAQRSMGWTPRGADGNSNASVDNKIGLIARAVGADPDAPLSQGQFLSLDMTALEGRAAGRNNPGNMKNTDGSWKQFDSPAAYQQSQRAWLQRRYNEGARTVRDAVEGRVTGAAPQGAGPRAGSNGIQTTNLGGGRTGPLWKDETKLINGQQISGQTNTQTGEFKPLGGAGKGTKPVDYDAQISSADNSLATIDRAMKHPGLNAAFGMPSLNPLDGNLFGKIIPGSPAADARALVETVKSQAFLAGIGQMRGQGALSDAEGAKISTAIANLSDNQSDEQIRANLGVIRNMVATGRNRMIQLRNRGGGGGSTAPTKTVNGRTYVKVHGGWKAQ